VSVLLTYLGPAGIAAVVLVIVNAILNRRKLSAETSQLSASATKTITDAASGVVAEIKADNERLRADNRRLERREEALERRVDFLERQRKEWVRERDEWRRVLMVHGAWDTLSTAVVKRAIAALAADEHPDPPIEALPEPPPLTPPGDYDFNKYEDAGPEVPEE